MQQAYLPSLSIDDYLAGELASEIRHEYVDGEVYAMAGAGRAHNLIVTNIVARLRVKARGTPCLVFATDMKVRVGAWNAFYYPDVAVSCDPSDDNEFYLTAPCLIVEVLSPSTEGIDRREKLLAHRTLESLREYVLIAQTNARPKCIGVLLMARGAWKSWMRATRCIWNASAQHCRWMMCTRMCLFVIPFLTGAGRDMVR